MSLSSFFFRRKPAAGTELAPGDPRPTAEHAQPSVRPSARPAPPDPPHEIGQARHGAEPASPPARPDSLDFTDVDLASDHVDAVDVQVIDRSENLPPLIEQVALLHADGDTVRALDILERECSRDGLGPIAAAAWTLRFELYQLLGREKEFELRALEFAGRFERSPPQWRQPSARTRSGSSVPTLALSGFVGAKDFGDFERSLRSAGQAGTLTLDLSGLTGVEPEVATRLTLTLEEYRRRACVVQLVAADGFLASVEPELDRQPGEIWLLMLAMLQLLGERTRFDELAIRYAVTFERSPPSWWEPRPAVAAPQDEAVDTKLVLAGELLGGMRNFRERWAEAISRTDHLDIDCAELKRIDQQAAAQLLPLLIEGLAKGKSFRLYNVSQLVGAALTATGISQLVDISYQKP